MINSLNGIRYSLERNNSKFYNIIERYYAIWKE